MNNKPYLIISPCRNEAEFMTKTLDSVINQSVLPKLWVIVNDGSTDETLEILEQYSSRYPFIRIVNVKDRGHRSVGPGVIEAFYKGLDTINIDDYTYLCKLDLDLILPEQYFELLICKMESNPRLGSCSGKAYFIDSKSGKLISEKCGDEAAIGASKFYRVSCFKQIGGFIRQVMWDGIDAHKSRQLGWLAASYSDENLQFIHLRPMGSSQKNIIAGRIRHGFGQYFMGTRLTYMTAASIYRLGAKPYIIGGLAMFWGYISSLIKRKKMLDDPELIKFIQTYQWNCLIKGKKKATEELNKQQESAWKP